MSAVALSRLETSSRLFAHTRADAIPVIAGLLNFLYVPLLFWLFPRLPLWCMLILGAIYSLSVSWNINGISHNFIHNPYFRWEPLNRAFALMESMALGFSQTFYDAVHTRHHMGNSDRQDDHGETVDWLSIYRHGHDGEAENPWSYIFLGYFRDDPKAIFRMLKERRPFEAWWGVFEIASFLGFFVLLGWLNWHFIVFFLPFYYLGHCLSYANGYYRHYGANPDVPIAWGVSTYHRFYNWLWFNNGYHAEHHYRPKVHWTQMKELHSQIADEQKAAGVRVIRPPHALGFLDPDLPPRSPGSNSSISPGTPAGA